MGWVQDAEARMTAEARKAMLESGDWLTTAEIAKLTGLSARHPSAQPNKWRKEGLIFAIRHLNIDYFPRYALDPAGGHYPFKSMAPVLRIFQGKKTTGINSFLGGKRPQDVLATQPERVLAAAQDEVAGILHG